MLNPNNENLFENNQNQQTPPTEDISYPQDAAAGTPTPDSSYTQQQPESTAQQTAEYQSSSSYVWQPQNNENPVPPAQTPENATGFSYQSQPADPYAAVQQPYTQPGGYYPPQPETQGVWTADGQFIQQTPYPGPYQQHPKTKKKKKGFTKGMAAGTVAACVVLSAAFGFGGSYLHDFLTGSNASGGSNKVIYQSVTPVDASGNQIEGPMTVKQIAQETAGSVVEITTETVTTGNFLQQYVSTGAGSGVIITSDGYIVTNNHVITKANKIAVRLKDGTSYEAKLIGTDPQTDIAVIKIDAQNLTPAVYGDSSTLAVGDLAVAIGNPLGQLGGTVTEGIISALDREIVLGGETMNLLQTNAAVNPGNSGGGLFNERGELIGIVNAKSSGENIEGIGFAVPINTAKTVIEQLISHGYVKGRVMMGVSVVDISDSQTAMMYRVSQLGVYVTNVQTGSPAQNAGVQVGDCILSIDGNAITDSTALNKYLNGKSVGDTIALVVRRNTQDLTLSLTLGEQSPS